jgi:lysozyme
MLSDEIKNYLDIAKEQEGFSGLIYKCPAGYLTFGYGHNGQTNPISKAAAEFILTEDLQSTENFLKTQPYYEKLKPNQKLALLAMCFQLGVGGFLGFGKMIKALKKGDFKKAAEEMKDSDWFKETPNRVKWCVDMLLKD